MIHITRETSTYIIIIVHEYVTCTSEEEPILPYMEVATIFGRLMSACAFRDIDYTTTIVQSIGSWTFQSIQKLTQIVSTKM